MMTLSSHTSYQPSPPGPSTPEQPPPVPGDLITSTSVTLKWNEPCPPGGIINRYTVNLVVTRNLFLEHHKTDIIKLDCVIGGKDGVNRNFSVPGNQTSLTVNDLSEYFMGLLLYNYIF